MENILIKVSRPNSETNKDGAIAFIVPENLYLAQLQTIIEDMGLSTPWDYSDKRQPANFADTRIGIYYEIPHDTTYSNGGDESHHYRGKRYEAMKTIFYAS